MQTRTVFFISDATGITAETFGNSILAQLSGAKAKHVRRPFIDTMDKARAVRAEIEAAAEREPQRPIVFITLVDESIRDEVGAVSPKALVLDMIRTFVEPLEQELGISSNHRVGRATDAAHSR